MKTCTTCGKQVTHGSVVCGECAPRWISVEERLPSEPGEYLVTYHSCYWDKVQEDIRVGVDTFRGKAAWAKKKYQRVTHWMPLPKPPEATP